MTPAGLSILDLAGICARCFLIAYWLPLVLLAWRAGAGSIAAPLTLLLLLLAGQVYRLTAPALRLAMKPTSTSRPCQQALPADDTH